MSNNFKVRFSFCLPIVIALLIISCDKDFMLESKIDTNSDTHDNLIKSEMEHEYLQLNLPLHLTTNSLLGPGQNAATSNDNTPVDNLTTNEGAALGRLLFYDKNLSANGKISCASCHEQELGFSDDRTLSEGFDGGLTRRHSMSLVNAAWYERGRFFWDERAASLEEQVLMPFQDPVEMGMTLDEVVANIEAQDYYESYFQDAFGSIDVTSEKIGKALAQFIRGMISYESKYDIARNSAVNPRVNFQGFTDSENRGKTIFLSPPNLGGAGCIGCHSTEAFINRGAGPTNNGLDLESTSDLGVFEAIPNSNFLGAFKVPSLKSIELTAPYMHDGRFQTLEEVVEHYNSGVNNHANLAPSLRDRNGQAIRLNLTDQEKNDLIAFMKTLTDYELAQDPKFSNPYE